MNPIEISNYAMIHRECGGSDTEQYPTTVTSALTSLHLTTTDPQP
jgi:hypothetical protein